MYYWFLLVLSYICSLTSTLPSAQIYVIAFYGELILYITSCLWLLRHLSMYFWVQVKGLDACVEVYCMTLSYIDNWAGLGSLAIRLYNEDVATVEQTV
jgi:hypothetical protein